MLRGQATTLVQDDSESHDAAKLTYQSWLVPLERLKLSANMQLRPE